MRSFNAKAEAPSEKDSGEPEIESPWTSPTLAIVNYFFPRTVEHVGLVSKHTDLSRIHKKSDSGIERALS